MCTRALRDASTLLSVNRKSPKTKYITTDKARATRKATHRCCWSNRMKGRLKM